MAKRTTTRSAAKADLLLRKKQLDAKAKVLEARDNLAKARQALAAVNSEIKR
jgi:hypothetical protein